MEDPLLMSVREAGAAHGPPNVPPEAAVSAHKASEPSSQVVVLCSTLLTSCSVGT